MTVQQIHEYIWSRVVQEMSVKTVSVESVKKEAVLELLYERRISYAAKELLYRHSYCVLCALYNCKRCPLKRCNSSGLYGQATLGNIEAALAISRVKIGGIWLCRKNKRMLEKEA